MRILKIDEKEGFIHVVPQTLDDLWHLERIVEKGDLVTAKSTRRFKASEEEGEKSERKQVSITVELEQLEFHRFSGKLRATGIVREAKPEEIAPAGSHHTVEIELGEAIKIEKRKLKKYQVERLRKAEKSGGMAKILLVAMDDEEAGFAVLRDYGLEKKGKVHAGKHGKQYGGEESEGKYFSEIIRKIQDSGAEKVIIAGPGFEKDNLRKYIEDKGVKIKAHFDSINSVGETGLNEIVKKGIVDSVVRETALSEETKLVERLIAEIGKDSGLAAYGESEVRKAIGYGAVEVLLITDKMLLDRREEMEELMENAEKVRAGVHIISSENEAGKQLEGISGIAAILRYRVE